MNIPINIWLNQQGIENNLKSVRAAIIKTTNELAKLPYQSEEWYQKSKKLSELKSIYSEMQQGIKATSEEIEKAGEHTKNLAMAWGGAAAVFQTASSAVRRFVSATQEYVEAYATLDDAMSAVQKTTGMTREEVEGLHKSLKSIDTRTSTNELLKIAEIGGRMGLAKDQIKGFTEAVNKANVALGDSFQGGAEEISSVLGKISLAYKETRDQDIGRSLTQIGSALNEVGASANATEGNIAAFVQRVGSMPEVFRPTVQQAVALGAAFEESSIDAEVASRAFGIVMMKASTNVEAFASAMRRPAEEIRNLINTNPAQFFVEFAASLKGLEATEAGTVLKDLNLNADGVNKIIGAMSTNTERFTEILNTSNTAFSEAISLDKEYSVVNENAAAQLEKAKKKMEDARAELGEKLIPILTSTYNILNSGTGLISRNIGLVKSLLQLVGGYISIVAGAIIKEKLLASWIKIKNEAMAVSKSFMAAGALITNTYALVQAKLAGNTIKAAQAQKALNTAMKANPWGTIITAITAAYLIVEKFASKQREANKAMTEFRVESEKEIRHVSNLFDNLKRASKGSELYERSLNELKETYPEVIAQHIDENGRLKDLKQAYDDVCASIHNKIALQKKGEKQDEIESQYIENQQKNIEKLVKNFDSTTGEIMRKRLLELVEQGNDWKSVVNAIDNEFGTNIIGKHWKNDYKGNTTNQPQTQDQARIKSLVDNYKEYSNALKNVEKDFAPFITSTENAISATAKLEDEIKSLNNSLSNAETKDEKRSIMEEIKAKKKELEELKKHTSQSQDSSSGYATENEDEKFATKRRKFDKELAEFRKKNLIDSKEGWQKIKAQTEKEYDDMIAKAISFYGKQSKVVKDLETEKGEAIIASGKKYLAKYGKLAEEVRNKMTEMLKGSGTEEDNKILADIAGSDAEWDKLIATIQGNIKNIETVWNDLTDEEKEDFVDFCDFCDKQEQLLVEATTNKLKAEAKILADHLAATNKMVAAKQKEQSRQKLLIGLDEKQRAEKEREWKIADMEEEYQLEIDMLEKVLAKKKELNDGDASGIQQIEETIAKLKELKNGVRDIVSASETKNGKRSGGVLDDLFNIDWKDFRNNWQDNLNTMTAALKEFADAAFDIFNSINRIQTDKENAAYDEWCEVQDAKEERLQMQLDNDIISQEYYNAQMQQIEDEKEAREKELQHQQFEREKKSNIIQATILGAVAVVQALAQLGPIAGPIAAALMAATTLAQIAVIASQANPYAKGGFIKNRQLILAGEEGSEWVASHKLLQNKETAPVIAALEDYQRGNRNALLLMRGHEPSWKNLSQSSRQISSTFARNSLHNTTATNDEVLQELKTMNRYLSDPKNRRAVIDRKIQLDFDQKEAFLKKIANL